MSPSAMSACSIYILMRVAESANNAAESRTIPRCVRSKSKRSKRMRQPVVEVSMAAVSLMKICRSASVSLGLRSSISIFDGSMPGDENDRLPMVPCSRMSSMKSSVFSLASCSCSASNTIIPFSKGQNCTSATTRRMSAIVSGAIVPSPSGAGFITRMPSMPKSSGKSRSTCSTVISMPVFSDA